MAANDLEAKKLHTGRLEEVLVIPMFDIFHVQRAQLAEKTESQNSLLFHFKASMAKVRTWNAGTIRNFIGGLTARFPVLGDEFEKTFQELQEVTCRVLNASSSLNEYNPVVQPTYTYLHELISSCADSFISHPEWFQVSQSSPEYQTVLNNMKARMAQSAVVPNSVMAFITTSRRDTDAPEPEPEPEPEQTNDTGNSDMDIYDSNSEASDVSSAKGSKSINIKSGLVTEEGSAVDAADDEQQPAAAQEVETQQEPPTENTDSAESVPDTQGAENREDEDEDDASDDISEESGATFFSDDEYSSRLSFGSSGSDGGTADTTGSESDTSSCRSSDASSDESFRSRDGTGDESSDEGSSALSSSTDATSLVWESVSDGSSYTAYGPDSGSDM